MKILITGATGFFAKNLADFYLKDSLNQVILTGRSTGYKPSRSIHKVNNVYYETVLDNEYENVVSKIHPNYIFHASAQSSPKLSWDNPGSTFDANLIGTLNLLNSIKNIDGPKPRLIFFSTSSVYDETEILEPIDESSDLKPRSPYAISKMACEYLCNSYIEAYGLDIVIVRPFFITGPGKENDVCSDWARKIVNIEKNGGEGFDIGETDGIIREFLAIDDAIQALDIIARKGTTGDVYNISSCDPISLTELLNLFRDQALVPFSTKLSVEKSRKINEKIKFGSNSKLIKLGWQRNYSTKDIVKSMLDYYRKI